MITATDGGVTSTVRIENAGAVSAWRLEPWTAIRVAGLPASVLSTLRLPHSPELARGLDAAEHDLGGVRSHAGAVMFDLVNGCSDVTRRRAALDVKRRLFRGKRLSADAAQGFDEGLPDAGRVAVARVVALEQQQATLSEHFEETFAHERAAVSESFRRVLGHDRLLAGLLLSGADHLVAARKLASAPPDVPLTSSQQLRESTIARYVFRAATRTTPFSGFAGVALARLDGTVNGRECFSARSLSPCIRWRSVPQLSLRHLQAFLARLGAAPPSSRQLLRVNPLRLPVDDPEPAVIFPRVAWTGAPGSGGVLEWMALQWSDAIASLLRACDGRTLDDAVRALAPDDDGQLVRDALRQLIEGGLIESASLAAGSPSHLCPEATPDAIRAVADDLRANDQAQEADAIRGVAEALEAYSTAGIDDRYAWVRRISSVVAPESTEARPPVLEDVVLDGITATALPIAPDVLLAQLEPVLRLVRASACHAAHRLMCAAFVQRFGRDGVCRDVGAFITALLRDAEFLSRIRGSSEPIHWLTSELGRFVAAAAEADCLRIEPSLFDALAVPDGPFATALFLQCARTTQGSQADVRVIVNGAQAGRGKYLSRYLGSGGPAAAAAYDAIRDRLAPREGPLPVEIAPTLGLNFQIHPSLTQWRLESPWEPSRSTKDVLRVADLTLRFDGEVSELRTRSCQLDRDIDLVHLGFLRDSALPDPHFLLRALSPRLCEDTVAERADLYNVLDRLALARNLPLLPHRPRLEVGMVVLERERWAVPAAVVPCRDEKQSYSDYFRSVSRFRRAHDLPARGFVRYVRREATGFGLAETRMYVDWESPLTLSGLTRFVRANRAKADGETDGYIVMTELLPDPESSWLRIDDEPHAAELVVELETRRQRS